MNKISDKNILTQGLNSELLSRYARFMSDHFMINCGEMLRQIMQLKYRHDFEYIYILT